MEIRLYFECLEQAYHYVYPLIEDGIHQLGVENVSIRLVRKPRILRGEVSSLYAIYSLTTPDFLISLCVEDKEIPLILGEFSEAVFTEDHELQRSLVGIAAALAGCLHLKISGQKESPVEHGGRTEFDPLTVANALREVLGYDGYIIAKWPTLENNPYVLKRNRDFLSCPPNGALPLAEQTIRTTVQSTLQNYRDLVRGASVVETVVSSLSQTAEYRAYQAELSQAEGLDDLIQSWIDRSRRFGRRSRVYLQNGTLTVKINRFSHAADPDRGIMTFASLTVRADETLARYVVKGRQRSRTLRHLYDRFIQQARKEGVPEYFINRLNRHINTLTAFGREIDITELWVQLRTEWETNKVLASLAYFSDGLIVQDRNSDLEFTLRWNRSDIIMQPEDEHIEHALVRAFGFRRYGRPLWISQVSDVNEDEVTYVVVHRILKPNGFEIVSTSYPGAQGDAAILPERGEGRRQRRLYIDVIAWLPPTSQGPSSDISLEESKDRPDRGALQQIVEKLRPFKTDARDITALQQTLRKLNFERELRRIYIGVGFGATATTRTAWQPTEVDFIVRIIRRNRWDVAFFGNTLRYAFRTLSGDVELPDVWEVRRRPQTSFLSEYL
jgi:hypothetical protein